MRKVLMVAALAAGVAGVGCSTLGRGSFAEPVVHFRDVRVNGVGLQGGNVDIVLSVYNPNNFKLDATRFTYRLLVDTTAVGNGSTDQHFAVQKKDSTEVRLPLAFNWSGLGELGKQLMNTGTVNYRVVGDITVATPIGNFTRPYDQTGRFSTLGSSR